VLPLRACMTKYGTPSISFPGVPPRFAAAGGDRIRPAQPTADHGNRRGNRVALGYCSLLGTGRLAGLPLVLPVGMLQHSDYTLLGSTKQLAREGGST
jgi:hypothetical protein